MKKAIAASTLTAVMLFSACIMTQVNSVYREEHIAYKAGSAVLQEIVIGNEITAGEDITGMVNTGDHAGAIMYLGYNGITANTIADAVNQYDILNDIDYAEASAPGNEIYFFTPASDCISAEIYRMSDLDENGNMTAEEIIWKSQSGKPVVFTCNASEIFSNTLIKVTAADGEVTEFQPGISLKNGVVMRPYSILDITPYEDEVNYRAMYRISPDTEYNYNDASLKVFMADINEYYEGSLAIEYQGTRFIVQNHVLEVTDSYIIPRFNGGFLAIVQECVENDWRYTYLIEYSAEYGFMELDRIEGGFYSEDDVADDGLIISSRIQALGTYGTEMKYRIINGAFVEDGHYLKFSNYYDENMKKRELVSTRDISALCGGNTITIPGGSTLYPMGYDTLDDVFYFEYQGNKCRFKYDRSGYPRMIDGIDENDIFEELFYAG